MREIRLNTPSCTGKICIGTGVIEERLPSLTTGQANFVVTDATVFSKYGAFFERYFDGTQIFVLEVGEAYKTFDSLCCILEKMTGAGMRRTDRLFAVGGGVVGDIGGLAAALYMRGISYVQIPTTLLAQVDSSVGGKTAVDFCGMKNIVGAFYSPCETLVDPVFLHTLPAREIKCGLGEIVKYAALDIDILRALESWQGSFVDISFLQTLVERCVQYKARVVQADERETGIRKALNLGHTTAHAIEIALGLSHGEAVLYGMEIETQIAIDNGVCERSYGQRILSLVRRALACEPMNSPDFSNLSKHAWRTKLDKKNTYDNEITLVVAKRENEWMLLSLPYPEYESFLAKWGVEC